MKNLIKYTGVLFVSHIKGLFKTELCINNSTAIDTYILEHPFGKSIEELLEIAIIMNASESPFRPLKENEKIEDYRQSIEDLISYLKDCQVQQNNVDILKLKKDFEDLGVRFKKVTPEWLRYTFLVLIILLIILLVLGFINSFEIKISRKSFNKNNAFNKNNVNSIKESSIEKIEDKFNS